MFPSSVLSITWPRFHPSRYLHLVRASGLYDLLLTVGFATPWTLAWLLPQLSALNQALGGQAFPAFEPLHALFCQLMGSLVTVWSLLRLWRPQIHLGRFDAAARALFSLWMALAWWQTQAPLLLVFLLPEMLWGLSQAWPIRSADQ
ncbi:hypothetical protein C1O66_11150 [Paucibacter aquatile]|uniref:DUF4345 domain-containing protein n=1 Tax=Kinneretia aquatilis TaxID=2070761 RepID=A0A2N8KX39_9BURK|nr:hypothetical protein [Paucibacter aquatile]PND38023.1 hypothetical protein C1O66_11150 [Paucibacter aquatile]WIV96917.1 hypothetical protein K9V56_018090 [Paucibacter aquatile]